MPSPNSYLPCQLGLEYTDSLEGGYEPTERGVESINKLSDKYVYRFQIKVL